MGSHSLSFISLIIGDWTVITYIKSGTKLDIMLNFLCDNYDNGKSIWNNE